MSYTSLAAVRLIGSFVNIGRAGGRRADGLPEGAQGAAGGAARRRQGAGPGEAARQGPGAGQGVGCFRVNRSFTVPPNLANVP